MAISGGDGSIILTTKVDDDGLKKGIKNLKSDAKRLGEEHEKAGRKAEDSLEDVQKEIKKTSKETDKLNDKVDDFGDKGKKSSKTFKDAFSEVGTAFAGITAGATAVVGSLFAIVDATKETIEDMGKLEAGFKSAGHSSETARKSFVGMVGILGETDQSVEAVNHLAMLTQSEEELAEWTTIATGVYAKFGDSLPLEGLTEAANETARVGQVTGPLADALNWAGISEDEFNAKLAQCNSTQERATLITQTLSDTYRDSAEAYREVNGDLIASRQATAEFDIAMSNLGRSLMPITTELTNIGTTILQTLSPALDDALRKLSSLDTSEISQELETINTSIGKISTAVEPLLTKISESTINDTIQNLGESISLISSELEIVSALANGEFGFFTEQDISYWINLVTELVNIKDTIGEIVSLDPSTIFADFFSEIIGGGEKTQEEMIEILETTGGWAIGIQEIFTGVLENFKTTVDEKFNQASELVKIAWGGISGFFSNIWEEIKSVFSEVGSWFSNIFSQAWKGIQNAWSGIVSFFTGIWNNIKNVFSDAKSNFLSIGSDIVAGIKQGISAAWSDLTSWFSGLFGDLKSIAKKILGIESPSRVFRDEVGKMIPAGMAIGIDKAKNLVTEATKALVTDTRTEVQKVLDDMNEEMLESEKLYAEESLRIEQEKEEKEYQEKLNNAEKKLKEDKKNAEKKLKEDKKNAEKKLKEDKKNAKKQLDEKKNNAEKSEEIEEANAKYEEKIAEANAKYEEKIAEANAKYEEEIQKIHNDKIKKEQEQAGKEYLDNLKDTAKKERKIYEARQKDIENAQKNILNAYEDAANDMLDAIEDLQKRQESLADKLFDFGDVMEDVAEIEDKFSDIHSPITEKDGIYVLERLGSQTQELERYLDLMTNLRDREGMSAELFDVVKNMSYEESFAYAEKLMRMGDKQFTDYIEKWQTKQATSKRITEELFGDDGSMGAKRILSDLTDQTSVLKDYYSLLEQVKDRAELPEGFFDTLRDMGIEEGLEYANALLELSDEDFANYIKSWEEKQKTSQLISKELYKDEAEQLATEIGDKFDEVEKEFFGVGENAADQFESGFLEQLKTVVSNIKGTISGAFSNVGLETPPNYDVGSYSINVPALARGSVLPGGKPFLAIVNDQPRGQTNIEAPLQTIVDAMNIALNNRGGSEIIREEHYNLGETELMTILHKLVKGGERLKGKSLISGGAY